MCDSLSDSVRNTVRVIFGSLELGEGHAKLLASPMLASATADIELDVQWFNAFGTYIIPVDGQLMQLLRDFQIGESDAGEYGLALRRLVTVQLQKDTVYIGGAIDVFGLPEEERLALQKRQGKRKVCFTLEEHKSSCGSNEDPVTKYTIMSVFALASPTRTGTLVLALLAQPSDLKPNDSTAYKLVDVTDIKAGMGEKYKLTKGRFYSTAKCKDYAKENGIFDEFPDALRASAGVSSMTVLHLSLEQSI